MTAWMERRLKEFVDRSDEMQRCTQLLHRGGPERIACVWGEANSGKSSFLMRLRKEVPEDQFLIVEIDWKGAKSYDYLAFMRAARGQLGDSYFPRFTELVNFFTKPDYKPVINIAVPGNISILQDADLSGQINSVTGVHIHDFGIVVPRSDLGIDDVDRMIHLTSTFIAELKALSETRSVLFLLDTLENASSNTENWLWDELFTAVRQDRAGDVLIVSCSRKPPRSDDGWTRDLIELMLHPLSVEHVTEYLERRGVEDPTVRTSLARMMIICTKGVAGHVANTADAFFQGQRNSPP